MAMKKVENAMNACKCCSVSRETKCKDIRVAETGFCTLTFTNFVSCNTKFHLDDSIKEYINTQSEIF